MMTDNLLLAQHYDVSRGMAETIDVDTAKYSKIRVIAKSKLL
ncbi:MAG: hypothetical protein WBZ36_21540 [Candidatus Nitrosopolaris sp.]